MLVRPRCPANAAPLASNARPMPAIFVLRVQVGPWVAEGHALRSAPGLQVVEEHALAEAVGVQAAEACAAVAVAEGDVDD